MKLASHITNDMICALATPVGMAAISVIRLSGQGCIDTLARCFSQPQKLLNSAGHRVHHGWIKWNSSLIDEVLITVFRAPQSYTGEDCAEISCHGGLLVFESIMQVLREIGFRDAAEGEFSFRAFSNGKMDLTRAEAVQEIIEARGDRSRAMATQKLAGSLENAINQIKNSLLSQTAIASLALDYPEDEVENIPLDFSLIKKCQNSLQELLSTWRIGKICQQGIKTVLAGPTNAGKSSLFNLFLRQERSIVTETPGTTRDWVQASVNLGGLLLELIDTAGLHADSTDTVEQEGIKRTYELIKSSDLIIIIADASLGLKEALILEESIKGIMDEETEGSNKTADRLIRVWNKSDLNPGAPHNWIEMSVLMGKGFKNLEEAMLTRVNNHLGAGESHAPVVSSARQNGLLQEASAALERLLKSTEESSPLPYDLLAEDLHDALNCLGEITGTITRTDVLNTVFSSFCVGK